MDSSTETLGILIYFGIIFLIWVIPLVIIILGARAVIKWIIREARGENNAKTRSKQIYERRPDAMSRNCEQNVLDQLEKLGQLKEKGILTEDEFRVQKGNLLCSNVAQEKPAEIKREINVYGEYRQIPWYRRNGFVMFSFLFLWPLCFLILLTGEVYYLKNYVIKKYGKLARALLCVGTLVLVGLSIYCTL